MKEQKLYVLVDQASLEAQKINGKFEILTPDNHQSVITKMGKKLSDYNPELVHQCLLMLLDSPLNREEKLKVRSSLTRLSPSDNAHSRSS